MSNAFGISNCSEPTDCMNCAICGAALMAGACYVVRIDIFADPAWSDSELPHSSTGIQESLEQVINQAASMTADALLEKVHRRFEYRICPRCHRTMLDNPLDLPRRFAGPLD
jgi:hypothetical protein